MELVLMITVTLMARKKDIIRETRAYLDDKGQSYKVPSSRMLAFAYQFSPNHEHGKMATMFTGKSGVKHKFKAEMHEQTMGMATGNLVEEAKCDTQLISHMLPWNAAIYARQSWRTIVSERDETVAGDHDFKCDKVVASVIHRLNIAKDVEESQYSGGPEGNCTIAVAFHDSTLEPSDIFTHNACVLNGMEDLAVAEMNRCTFENMSDTDDEEDQIKRSYLDYMPYIFLRKQMEDQITT
eukprot:scaffold150431_cov65-Attheya_sp.AAC.5